MTLVKTAQSEVTEFEEEFADLLDGRHSVALGAGAGAVQLVLAALAVGVGDEVVVPSYAPEAVARGVRLVGAEPVFADIEPDSLCVGPEAVEAALSPRTAAVVAVHAFGHPAAMERICEVARRHGIPVVEEASHALGAKLHGRPVGTFGTAAVFGTGAGCGAVVTGDARIAGTVRGARDRAGRGPSAAEAAEGLETLRRTAGLVARRRALARVLDGGLRNLGTPRVADGAHHAYHCYPVRVPGNGRPDRDAFARALAARGVGASAVWPTPVHRMREYRGKDVRLPETERAVEQVLCLPVDPMLTERGLGRIVSACNSLGGLL